MRLSPAQVDAFRTDGVVVARGVLAPAALDPVIAEIEAFVARRAAALQAGGHLRARHEGAPFARRYALLLAQTPEIRRGMGFTRMAGPAMFELLRCPALLDAVASLLGEELALHPLVNLRPKPPRRLDAPGPGFNAPPWHQDAASLAYGADATALVTCWIPLVDVTRAMGCLEVMPGVGRYLPHQVEGGLTIVPGHLPAVASRALVCRRGDVILFDRHTPHRSRANRTGRCRWSIDVRYHPADQPAGRPGYPSFTVRSAAWPGRVVDGYEAWRRAWDEAHRSGVRSQYRDDVGGAMRENPIPV